MSAEVLPSPWHIRESLMWSHGWAFHPSFILRFVFHFHSDLVIFEFLANAVKKVKIWNSTLNHRAKCTLHKQINSRAKSLRSAFFSLKGWHHCKLFSVDTSWKEFTLVTRVKCFHSEDRQLEHRDTGCLGRLCSLHCGSIQDLTKQKSWAGSHSWPYLEQKPGPCEPSPSLN